MATKRQVTKANFAALLIEGLKEAVAVQRGELDPARVHVRVLSQRDVEVVPPEMYDAERIQLIRERLQVSQAVFAKILNASPAAVRAWEQGARDPDGTSLRLLEVAERYPEAVLGTVRPSGGTSKKGQQGKPGATR